MNILITGATGFLGSHILKGLIKNTSYNIIVVKRTFSDVWRIKDLINNNRIKFYDIDKCDLENVFQENNINLIIHCATSYGRTDNSSYSVLETNLMLPVKLLDLSVKYGVQGFINTDSYFNKDNMSYSYLLNYALSKKSLLLWLKHFSKKIKTVNMVLEHIFGEDDRDDKFVTKMLNLIALKKVPSVDLTSGEQKRDFIYVDDVVKAYLKVINFMNEHSFRYRTFDVGTGSTLSIRDFVSAVKLISDSPTKLNFGALPYREDEIMCSCADIVDLVDIGWAPEYNLNTALMKIIGENK